MANLVRAHRELFRRSADERFVSIDALVQQCRQERRASVDRWHLPQLLQAKPAGDGLCLTAGPDGDFALNDWSFTQLCRLSGVSKDTVNRVSPETASRVLLETMPTGQKPMQVMTTAGMVRSIHGVSYSRLWNADLLDVIQQRATDFQPPPVGFNGATGLYYGEQDMFCFLIDPAGWIDIDGEEFAPGFFVWNSEVGRRSLGISTFWFQKVCRNHIVWDAVDVEEFSRKHTGNIQESLVRIEQAIDSLVRKREARKDGFAETIRKAIGSRIGADADEAQKFLFKQGIPREAVQKAVTKLQVEGKPFTIWTLVDALTQLNCTLRFAGDRMDADQKVAQLLALAV
ncbi:MAG: DUF932 domain-containing protein [Planctomycetes bacterium]|nr:DUF932 domain-containing protein [Planctomycetota bacterium]